MNLTSSRLIHPATTGLLCSLFRARVTRMGEAFSNPRRKLLAGISIVLAGIWLSQAIASVLFRQAADPERLKFWIPLGLLIYSGWHVIKTVTRRSTEPFDWTGAERELLLAAPISRTHMISFRMASSVSSALVKSLCFSIVMIPDLSIWACGLVGMFLGLIFVDLIRVCFELMFFGLSRLEKRLVRVATTGVCLTLTGLVLIKCCSSPQTFGNIASPAGLLFLQQFMGEFVELAHSRFGLLLLGCFAPFGKLILASSFDSSLIVQCVLAVLMVFGLASCVYALDGWGRKRNLKREKELFRKEMACLSLKQARSSSSKRREFVPPRIRGAGSLAWRQLLGAVHYKATVATSLGIPVFLCCIPLFADHGPVLMLMNIVAGLVFYSFLLLPSALMLDFRRDVNRLAVLKGMPISPLAVTIGQLAAPVLLCSSFQLIVLIVAVATGSVIAWHAVIALVLLIPVNTLIFAIENYAFLLSPYRRNREGIDVFLRTILTFTGKSLLFAVALAGVLVWAFASNRVCQWVGVPATAGIVFGLGVWVAACSVSWAFVSGVVRLFTRLDTSEIAIES
ncbi:MAG: hypothetical protein ACI87E_004010 [Mariniblastus sp.]|jgi:hypothetical protein